MLRKTIFLLLLIMFFADWELEKRVTELRLIDVSHSGINIVEGIEFVVYDPVWFEGQDLFCHT